MAKILEFPTAAAQLRQLILSYCKEAGLDEEASARATDEWMEFHAACGSDKDFKISVSLELTEEQRGILGAEFGRFHREEMMRAGMWVLGLLIRSHSRP